MVKKNLSLNLIWRPIGSVSYETLIGENTGFNVMHPKSICYMRVQDFLCVEIHKDTINIP
jgi:hypothetical protein